MLLPEGLIPASYTPFTPDYKLDTKTLLERLESVTEGVTGLHGPTNHGEMCELTFDEWKLWIDIMLDVCKRHNLNSWSFLGTESFEKTIPYAEYAIKSGTSGIILHAPYKVKYSIEAAYEYVKAFTAEFPETPFIFYPNFNTGSPTDPDLVKRLSELPNIVGAKMTRLFDIEQAGEVYRMTRGNPNFRIVTGSLLNLYPLRGLDIRASFSPQSNYVHDWSLMLWKAMKEKDWDTADIWYDKINKLHHAFCHPGGYVHTYAAEKAAMEMIGKPVGTLRRPGLPATEEQKAVVRKALVEAGLI